MNELKHTGPHQVQLSQWISEAPFERLLNMKIERACKGEAVLSMPFFEEYAQGAGLMHGGALTALADTAVAMAIKSVLPEDTHFGTIALETRFLNAVRQGWVTAQANVISQQGRDLVGQATVFDDQQQPVIEFESHFRVARRQNHQSV
ncbi:MAG: PaaI family thioesterase [Oceanospirillaceae bacterium]|nr:PaaI family thioesterase [Oceanospirillaceae bacterium]